MKVSLLSALVVSTVIATGCGSKSSSSSDGAPGELIDVKLSFSEASGSLMLADASAFSMSVAGCASGYTTTVTQTSTSVKLYKSDSNCLVKLDSFTVGGVTYIPSAGDPFSTWLANDSATFQSSTDATKVIRVKVVAQVDSPVSGTEPVQYSYQQIDSGTDKLIASGVVSDGHALSVSGQGAPAFQIASVSYVGMTASGAGQFTFKLECKQAQGGSGASAQCVDSALSDIKYKLVEDTYSGTLTISQAAALMSSGAVSVAAGDVVDPGVVLVKGGFSSSTLTGPDQMHLKPNMILVLEAAGISYTYFNVDVETL